MSQNTALCVCVCGEGEGMRDGEGWKVEGTPSLPAQVDVMFHESHASISGPAFLVVVAHNVLIVGVRVLCEVALDQLPRLLCCEPTRTCIQEGV